MVIFYAKSHGCLIPVGTGTAAEVGEQSAPHPRLGLFLRSQGRLIVCTRTYWRGTFSWLAKLGGSLLDETCRPLPSYIIVSDGLHPHPGPGGRCDDGGGGVWDWKFPNEVQQRPLTASAVEVIEAGSEDEFMLDGREGAAS